MERRPKCHVYNEIITCRAIFLNLEESRSHGNEKSPEAIGTNGRPDGLGGRAPALPPWEPALASRPITINFMDYAPPT